MLLEASQEEAWAIHKKRPQSYTDLYLYAYLVTTP